MFMHFRRRVRVRMVSLKFPSSFVINSEGNAELPTTKTVVSQVDLSKAELLLGSITVAW